MHEKNGDAKLPKLQCLRSLHSVNHSMPVFMTKLDDSFSAMGVKVCTVWIYESSI